MGAITPKGVCAAVVAIGFAFVVTAIFLGLDLKPNIRGNSMNSQGRPSPEGFLRIVLFDWRAKQHASLL